MRFEVVVEILLRIQRYYASFVNRILKNTFKKKLLWAKNRYYWPIYSCSVVDFTLQTYFIWFGFLLYAPKGSGALMVEVWIGTMALQNLQQYGCQTGNKLKEISRDLNRNSSRFFFQIKMKQCSVADTKTVRSLEF